MSMANRQPRVDTRLPVVETTSGGPTYYTKNLSMGGLFLLTEKRWAVGSELNLTITFGRARLPINARVTHLQRDGVGMCFMEPSDAVREALRLLIASQIPASGSAAVLAWSDGKIRHEAAVRGLSVQGAFFKTADQPDIGSTIMVYVPSSVETEDAEIEHELRGCTAEVTAHAGDGFEARFSAPSAEFRMALDRLLRELS